MKGGNVSLVLFLSTCLLFHIARSQECKFRTDSGLVLYRTLDESAPEGTVIDNLQHDAGTVSCQNQNDDPFTDYINFTNNETDTVFFLSQSIGDAFDNGVIYSLAGNCELTCPDVETTANLVVFITIISENNRKPEFSQESIKLELDESMPVNLDFSYLLESKDGSLLTVIDRDCPFKPNGTVSFEIDADNADRFQILPPINFTRKVCEDSMTYAPRISLKRRLSAAEGDISFFLIAKDGGNPPQESRLPITITVKPEDLHDPVFDHSYYVATIQHPEDIGILNILPNKIHAKDGDVKINENIMYTIKDHDGLPLDIVNESDEGININLTSVIDLEIMGRENAYVLIEAKQIEQTWRSSTVVLIITLPTLVTTQSPTSTHPSDITSTQCPPCTTEASSTQTSTACPDVTTPRDPPSVLFEYPQYFSKISENSEKDSRVVVVKAVSNDGDMVFYSLEQTQQIFSINERSGEITLATAVTEGEYTFQVIAKTSSADDHAHVIVYVVKGPANDTDSFEYPLYSFEVNESYVGPIGKVNLKNGTVYTIKLTWVDPLNRQDYFSVAHDGLISVEKKLGRLSDSVIHLNISASDPTAMGTSPIIETIVVIRVTEVNEPPIFDYNTTLIVGYPGRTYIDPLVPMPLFTVQVVFNSPLKYRAV